MAERTPNPSRPVEARTRDFDYGVGDETAEAAEHARAEAAVRIRRAAATHDDASPAVLRAYETAARLAEDPAASVEALRQSS